MTISDVVLTIKWDGYIKISNSHPYKNNIFLMEELGKAKALQKKVIKEISFNNQEKMMFIDLH